MKSSDIIDALEKLSPPEYACEWDNVGLMVGTPEAEVKKILVALDGDDAAVDTAIRTGADMIITHHPLIFGSLKSVKTDDITGRRIISLIKNDVICYSMHTNFDVKGGMAELAAKLAGLEDCEVLEEVKDGEGLGRVGDYPTEMTVLEWAERVKQIFDIPGVMVYGDKDMPVKRIAISPGSGKDFVGYSLEKGAKLLVTGDINHHSGIDAVAEGLAIIDAGHYGTEYIFVKYIADYLRKYFSSTQGLEIVEMEKKLPYMIV